MNYVQDARIILEEELPRTEPELMDLYLLLLLTAGKLVSLEQVHDAWSIWKDSSTNYNASSVASNLMVDKHPALVPFGRLGKETQDKDQEYADGIFRAAVRLEAFKRTMGLAL